jgi:hypothetical protein
MTQRNIKRRCVGTVQSTGQPCKQAAIEGAVVCNAHGGKMPNIKKAAALRVTEAKVRAQIDDMRDVVQLTSVGDIYDDLLEVASVCRAWRRILQDRVSYLSDLHTYQTESGEQVRADVLLFERALERSAKVGEMLARLNLDERRQAIDERTAATIALLIQGVVSDLGLPAEEQQRAEQLVIQRVRELA